MSVVDQDCSRKYALSQLSVVQQAIAKFEEIIVAPAFTCVGEVPKLHYATHGDFPHDLLN
ncbi:hypothetical protein [Fischerella sp. JS2]|uniref:hypothetical protein n=1 Tax=Fischerella sp. JS2 TaxID=2597771 RepID=UPI0028E2470E|nr:hypothetical protein [Fischerella sp. JS2]